MSATALGAYLLLLIGATVSLADAAAACDTWPTCPVDLDGSISSDLAIVWGHRIAAAVVGALVVASALAAWFGETRTRVRTALAVAFVLYPIQIGIGAVTAVAGPSAVLPGLHLTVGIAIFGGIVLALAWALEAEAPAADHVPIAAGPAPESPAVARAAPVDSSFTVTEAVDAEDTTDSADRDTALDAGTHTVLAYVGMMKPRLMWLLCLVAAAGMALAAGPDLTVETVVATLLGGVLAIGASGTFNHVLERDVDRRMARTADRPLATDAVPVRHAIAFGAGLTVASMAVFLTLNPLAAALGLAAILFYSVVYTLLLKPHTVQNTVIGGAAGALPALIGWAAVTETIGVPALALAGLIFLWTPAHFYNLALAYEEDYARGGFPMLPVVRGKAVARKHVLWYLCATLLGATALAAVTDLGALYAATTVAFGGVFLWAAVRLHHERTERAAFRTFHASNAFLGAVLVAIVIDSIAL